MGREAAWWHASIDPRAAAFSLVTEIEGMLSLARNSQDRRVLRLGLKNLRRHLEEMRAAPRDPRSR